MIEDVENAGGKGVGEIQRKDNGRAWQATRGHPANPGYYGFTGDAGHVSN
jgi:hypothetical protein